MIKNEKNVAREREISAARIRTKPPPSGTSRRVPLSAFSPERPRGRRPPRSRRAARIRASRRRRRRGGRRRGASCPCPAQRKPRLSPRERARRRDDTRPPFFSRDRRRRFPQSRAIRRRRRRATAFPRARRPRLFPAGVRSSVPARSFSFPEAPTDFSRRSTSTRSRKKRTRRR